MSTAVDDDVLADVVRTVATSQRLPTAVLATMLARVCAARGWPASAESADKVAALLTDAADLQVTLGGWPDPVAAYRLRDAARSLTLARSQLALVRIASRLLGAWQ